MGPEVAAGLVVASVGLVLVIGATEGEPAGGLLDGDAVGLQTSGIRRQMVGFSVGLESGGPLVGASVATPDGSDPSDGAAVGIQSSGNNTQIVGDGPVGLGPAGVGRFEGVRVRSRKVVGAPDWEGTGVGDTVKVGTGV